MNLRNRLYFTFRKFLPWSIRIAIRRPFAKRKREKLKHLWPIDESASTPPANWQGWPDGKDFAFVLTHDVESQKGLDRVKQLAELEMELGFRSSFNFIPEGPYTVPDELITWLHDNGFEVGVHDHRHDGKLFNSEEQFKKSAERINHYLKKWGAVGYRSGFMLRNLDWFHHLNIEYDASTFDTDPFEPQPDGAGTIFPFFVERPKHFQETLHSSKSDEILRSSKRSTDARASPQNQISDQPSHNNIPNSSFNLHPSSLGSRPGYVELPYTLPQDSTLFLLFNERDERVWNEKLRWIVDKKGMSLLNTHPDYVNFDKRQCEPNEYSSDIYRIFLQSVKTLYPNRYWHTTAACLTSWFKCHENGPTKFKTKQNLNGLPERFNALKNKRVASLLYSYYPSDPRPRRAAEAMVDAGMHVEMICLREHENEPSKEAINGVHVTRISVKKSRDSRFAYIKLYLEFLIAGFARLTKRSLSKRYHLIHVHNMPDFLVFGALIPKMLGAKVALDLHDPMPELMRTIYGANEKGFLVKSLKLIERLSIGFADTVITVNDACKDIFSQRSCRRDKIHVIMNSPDSNIFTPKELPIPSTSASSEKAFRLMYHGSLVERNGLGLSIEAVGILKDRFPNLRLDIFGRHTEYLDSVMSRVREMGLEDRISYHGPKTQQEIVQEIDRSDLGLISNLRNIFTEINTPTRIFEFLMRATPVIAPRAEGITAYFTEESLLMFELGDAKDLANNIDFAITNPQKVSEITKLGQNICINRSWPTERNILLDLTASLVT